MHYLIVLGSYQGVYPNAHCSGVDKSKGSQWALSDPTVVHVYDYEGGRCAHSRVLEKLLITLLRLLRVASSLRIHVRTLFLSYVGPSISKRNSHFFDEQSVLSPEYACGCKSPTAKA